MLKELLESLDKEVFTEEAIEAVMNQFNEAVEVKAKEIADAAIEENTKLVEDKADAYIAESIATKEKELEEHMLDYMDKKMAEMNESLDLFLDKVVEEFAIDAEVKLTESLKAEKSDMLIEAFEAMVVAGGMELVKIAEAKDETEAETKLAESIKKYDELMVENLEIKKENNDLNKAGFINEMKAGLSLVESQKFEKMAEMIPFTRDEKFTEQLEIIKESVKGAPEKVEEVKATEAVITESKIEDKSSKVNYSHLV